MPLLLMHGEQDDLVPVHEGRLLFAKAQEPKYMVVFSNAGHNNLNKVKMTEMLTEFLRKQKRMPPH